MALPFLLMEKVEKAFSMLLLSFKMNDVDDVLADVVVVVDVLTFMVVIEVEYVVVVIIFLDIVVLLWL